MQLLELDLEGGDRDNLDHPALLLVLFVSSGELRRDLLEDRVDDPVDRTL